MAFLKKLEEQELAVAKKIEIEIEISDEEESGDEELKKDPQLSPEQEEEARKILQVLSEVDGPASDRYSNSGSNQPENWVSEKQSGLTDTEIHDLSLKMNDIVSCWQENALDAFDLYQVLMQNGGRYLEMHSPKIHKGLSRSKLEKIAEICQRLAQGSPIV